MSRDSQITCVGGFLICVGRHSSRTLALCDRPVGQIMERPMLVRGRRVAGFFHTMSRLPCGPDSGRASTCLETLRLPMLFHLRCDANVEPGRME